MGDSSLCSRFCSFWYTENMVEYIFFIKSNALHKILCHSYSKIMQRLYRLEWIYCSSWTSSGYQRTYRYQWGHSNCKWFGWYIWRLWSTSIVIIPHSFFQPIGNLANWLRKHSAEFGIFMRECELMKADLRHYLLGFDERGRRSTLTG